MGRQAESTGCLGSYRRRASQALEISFAVRGLRAREKSCCTSALCCMSHDHSAVVRDVTRLTDYGTSVNVSANISNSTRVSEGDAIWERLHLALMTTSADSEPSVPMSRAQSLWTGATSQRGSAKHQQPKGHQGCSRSLVCAHGSVLDFFGYTYRQADG